MSVIGIVSKGKIALTTSAGVVIAFAGAAIIIGKPWHVSADNPSMLFGNIMFFVAVLSGVISTIIVKPILNKITSYQATFIILFAGTLPIVPFALLDLRSWSINDISSSGWTALIYGIIAVPLANFLHLYGLKHKRAYSVGIFEYVEKIVIIVAAWFILNEHPSPKFALGAALTFFGVYLAEIKVPKRAYIHRVIRGR